VRLYIVNIVFSISISFGTFANVSEKIFENRESSSYVFGYSIDKSSVNTINNYFIKEIARYNLSNVFHTQYTFHYEVNNLIQLTSPNTFTVSTEILGQKCTGDIMYKDFDISDILMPEKMNVKLILLSEGKYITSKEFFGVALDDSSYSHIEFIYETLDENRAFTLKIENISFYSDLPDQDKFNNRINQVDNYYASIAILKKALQDITAIDLRRNSILDFYIKLKELERMYNHVAQNDFIAELGIRTNDNGGFFEHLTTMRNQLVRFNEYFNILIQSAESFRLSKSLRNYAELYVAETSNYLVQSQKVTNAHSGFYYRLGYINYNQSMVNQYYQDLKQVIDRTRYRNSDMGLYHKLEVEIFNTYLDKATEMIKSEQYHLATGLLKNAENLYKVSFNREVPVSLNILISKANYGIFDSYLKLIDRAIKVGNYNLAENYLDRAMNFQIENSVSIISNDYIIEISEKLALLYISQGTRLTEEGEYKNATLSFEQAAKLCHRIGRFNYDYEIKHGLMNARNGLYKSLINRIIDKLETSDFESAQQLMVEANQLAASYYYEILYSPEHVFIRSAINRYYYHQMIQSGKSYLESGDYQLAYQQFLAAFDLEATSNFDLSPELPELFYRAATPVLIDLCSLGEVKVRKNQLDEARIIYDNCLQLQDDYGLIYQSSVQESITLLNNSIFNRHCDFVIQEFEKKVAIFDNLIDQSDFISAIALLNNTDSLTYKNFYCDLDRSLIKELRAMYSPAAEYQQLAKIAQDALSTGNHEKFIEAHERMEFLSDNHEVIRKYIEPLPLHYLFSVKKNLALLENAIEYFKSKESFEVALDLLAVLEANNYTDRDTKAIQQKLGSRMALADRECIYTADPNVIVDEYTEGKTYLKHFKKAYIKSW
jgi:hypothetical protein